MPSLMDVVDKPSLEGAIIFNNMEHYKNLSLENIEGEIWKDIKDYECYYQISNMGRVKTLKRYAINKLGNNILVKNIIRKQWTHSVGYLNVWLKKNGNKKQFFVHRLVAMEFISNNENKPTVNHKDGNKKNNNIENLEWNTHKENSIHAYKKGLMKIKSSDGENNSRSILKESDVLLIRDLYVNKIYSINELSKIYGVVNGTIHAVVTRRNWKNI